MEPDPVKDPGTWANVIKVIKKPLYLAGFLVLLLMFLAGTWYGSRDAGQSGGAGKRRILHYVDPMNPAHTSPEPGLAPCGMQMEPVYADSQETIPANLPPGTVKVSPRKQQLIGVRLGVVEKTPYTHTLRALGRVAVDETRIYRLNSFVDGWILKTLKNTTGSLVMKDESLASYYSRDFITAQQAFFYALSTLDRLKKGDQLIESQLIATSAQIRGAEENLENLGMSKSQVKELAQNRRLTQDIYLRAPVTSFILARNVSPGQKISRNDELYKLADLSRVWIVADLYENEAPFIKPGARVRTTMPYRHTTSWATVTDIIPEFDKTSKTLRVRLEADNPDYGLRPDMFVDVEFPVDLPATVHVPVDAILDTGLKKIAFVDRGDGFFEPRRVETGWRFGGKVEVTQGLKPGERIVTSGNFLIDSESRMKLAAAGMYGEVIKDPVCGGNLDESKAKVAGHQSQFQNKTYYFCSEDCQREFEKHPERYVDKDAVTQAAAGDRGALAQKPQAPVLTKDPVCGHEVDVEQAKAGGLKSEHHGKTYYFCRYQCNKEFDKDPERYLKGEAKAAEAAGAAHGEVQPAMAGTAKDPVCGQDVDPAKAAAHYLKREFQGKTYYFCRDFCSQQFDQDPKRYISKAPTLVKAAPAPEKAAPAPCCQSAPVAQAGPSPQPAPGPASTTTSTPQPSDPERKHFLIKSLGLDGYATLPEALQGTPYTDKDPVCGMKLGPDVVQGLAYRTPYQGKIYYFCSVECKEAFDKDPESYVRKLAAAPAPMTHPMPAAGVAGPAPPGPVNQDKTPPNGPAGPQQPKQAEATPAPAASGSFKDPVSGQDVGKGSLRFKSRYKGKTYFFCSMENKKEFDKNPERYVQKSVDAALLSQQQVPPAYPTRGKFRNMRGLPRSVVPPIPPGAGAQPQ